jgi:methionyl-tRNA formyltransferase
VVERSKFEKDRLLHVIYGESNNFGVVIMSGALKVYFLGAGMISVPVLKAVYDSDKIDLVGIGTQPDRLAGRKKVLVPTPVGAWAQENGVKIDKPDSVNSREYLDKLKALDPDFILVISFGQLLKEESGI